MSSELRLFGERFRSCQSIVASVEVHRHVPNVTAEPQRDSIPQGATPASWVVQDKTLPNRNNLKATGKRCSRSNKLQLPAVIASVGISAISQDSFPGWSLYPYTLLLKPVYRSPKLVDKATQLGYISLV